MCGRFSQSKSKQEIKKRFNVKKVAEEVMPLFNVAPYMDVAVILNDSPDEIKAIQWGLLPPWCKTEKNPYNMINAKGEEILEKKSFKSLIKNKRCIIIAESIYEWEKFQLDKAKSIIKIPHRILLKTGDLFAMAGLWDLWEKDGKKILSCTIITTAPNALCVDIHDRMPVILPKELEKEWLSDIPVERSMAMLKPYPSDQMTSYTVSSDVNNPRNNSPELHIPFTYPNLN